MCDRGWWHRWWWHRGRVCTQQNWGEAAAAGAPVKEDRQEVEEAGNGGMVGREWHVTQAGPACCLAGVTARVKGFVNVVKVYDVSACCWSVVVVW